MKERPILFNAEMVRAIFEGRKTQTRRICKIDSPTLEFDTCNPPWPTCEMDNGFGKVPCPYGQPGDRLWVRETFAFSMNFKNANLQIIKTFVECNVDNFIEYGADGFTKGWVGRIWPSIHMPRWASRITLEITNVRVERLQDISEEDAKAEGVINNDAVIVSAYRWWFEILWNKINGPGAWAKNPWVWAIEFKRICP